jgi:hypothetical protein
VKAHRAQDCQIFLNKGEQPNYQKKK